jgi:coproporphyrinogen III oxidase-like Fe-S oxidoreductase
MEKVVRAARDVGFACSGDLLFNLPGQSLEQMKADVDAAIALGLEQVCIYHLVLFEGLGTTWSKQPELVAALPQNAEACRNWLALREHLFERGYVQATLTNFERKEISGTARAFQYEPLGFAPERHDIVGFGPSGLTLLASDGMTEGVKLLNPEGSAEYTEAVTRGQAATRFFGLGPLDMRILFLTRKLASLRVDRALYRSLFKRDLCLDFPAELEALLARGLVQLTESHLSLTPEGMFYADSVAGLLAWSQVERIRVMDRLDRWAPHRLRDRVSYHEDLNQAVRGPMG